MKLKDYLEKVIDNQNNALLDDSIEQLNEYCLNTYNCNYNELDELLYITFPNMKIVKEIIDNYFAY